MADSPAFEYVSHALADQTSLESIEARGTIRIALKTAGLTASSVTAEQMAVVLERIVPTELEKRGIQDAQNLCGQLRSGVVALQASEPRPESPESVFHRLGGSR